MVRNNINRFHSGINIFFCSHHLKYLKKFYWGERTLWSGGYFASTIGNFSKEIAEAYGIGAEVNAYISQAKGPGVLRFVL